MDTTEILVERIDGNVRHVRERLDEHIVASAGLSGRVSALEKAKDRAVAWAAGAAAVAAFLVWVLGLGGVSRLPQPPRTLKWIAAQFGCLSTKPCPRARSSLP